MTTPRLSVREILHPRAVAVFGASEDRGKFGGRIIHFLIQHGFAMAVSMPINPRRKEILGHRAYPALTDAPPGVEVAILAVTTSQLFAGGFEQCAAAGVGAASSSPPVSPKPMRPGADLQP